MTRYAATPATRDTRAGLVVGALLAVGLLLGACGVLPSTGTPGGRVTVGASGSRGAGDGVASGDPAANRARATLLLERVRVVAARTEVPGYDRDCGPGDGCVFGTTWSDDTDAPSGHNGCDTRNDVLGAALRDVRFEAGTRGCDVVAGLLRDPYTGTAVDYATHGSQIHVDHLVPLAAAWDLGAATWPPSRRAAFANDTERELLAVSERANLSKGDSTPADWLPPDPAARCGYVTDYLEVVDHYDLAVTRADAEAVGHVLQTSC